MNQGTSLRKSSKATVPFIPYCVNTHRYSHECCLCVAVVDVPLLSQPCLHYLRVAEDKCAVRHNNCCVVTSSLGFMQPYEPCADGLRYHAGGLLFWFSWRRVNTGPCSICGLALGNRQSRGINNNFFGIER